VITYLLIGALSCYALMRHRSPKPDPTCDGRIVPNGTQAQRDAIISWHKHEHDTFAARHDLAAAAARYEREYQVRKARPKIDYLAPYRPKQETPHA
jgi:hypothetical protein